MRARVVGLTRVGLGGRAPAAGLVARTPVERAGGLLAARSHVQPVAAAADGAVRRPVPTA